ncbi:hypothetical protein CDIK_1848 [Cucumispora dikerogammari]|nr:hypothetical protein CDIK_1848 [Cucumispora dikerogammari]
MDDDLLLLRRDRKHSLVDFKRKQQNERIIAFKKKYQTVIEDAMEENPHLAILLGYFYPLNMKLSKLIFKLIKESGEEDRNNIFKELYLYVLEFDTENEKESIVNKAILVLSEKLRLLNVK